MEWLEFQAWSKEVTTYVAAHVDAHKDAPPPVDERLTQLTRRVTQLLRSSPPMNPWGHPPALC